MSGKQGNNFAKTVADDFNPIHDTDSKRFCVPGDLLFAIALEKYGLRESMSFKFRELIKADTPLTYPDLEKPLASKEPSANKDKEPLSTFDVICDRCKPVLGIEFAGASTHDTEKIEQLIRNYVVFSGQNFPHILVPLMQQHKVMIHPTRPLVIYESMSLSFDTLDFGDLRIELGRTELEVLGKRGNAQLHFDLNDGDKNIGTGLKRLVLSGLREYDQAAIDVMCEKYKESKLSHLGVGGQNL